MTATLFLTALVASLLGSLHCAGMCGPLVACYAACDSRGDRVRSHASYQLGRLLGYLGLGAAAGLVGRAADLVGLASGAGRLATVLSGSLIGLFGLFSLLRARGVDLWSESRPSPRGNRLVKLFTRLRDKPPLVRAGLFGLGSGLLPCGWLYAFVVAAAGTAEPWSGALLMAALWLGGLPVLLSLATVARRLQAALPTLSALVLIALGLFTVIHRSNIPAQLLSTTQSIAGAVPARPAAECH